MFESSLSSQKSEIFLKGREGHSHSHHPSHTQQKRLMHHALVCSHCNAPNRRQINDSSKETTQLCPQHIALWAGDAQSAQTASRLSLLSLTIGPGVFRIANVNTGIHGLVIKCEYWYSWFANQQPILALFRANPNQRRAPVSESSIFVHEVSICYKHIRLCMLVSHGDLDLRCSYDNFP